MECIKTLIYMPWVYMSLAGSGREEMAEPLTGVRPSLCPVSRALTKQRAILLKRIFWRIIRYSRRSSNVKVVTSIVSDVVAVWRTVVSNHTTPPPHIRCRRLQLHSIHYSLLSVLTLLMQAASGRVATVSPVHSHSRAIANARRYNYVLPSFDIFPACLTPPTPRTPRAARTQQTNKQQQLCKVHVIMGENEASTTSG